MSIKYQIFVSSTYEDLKDERDQVIRAILEMGHIPVGMEMFSAADETQWKIITRQIEECDYYVVIVAHRYGSTVDGVSYTEKEYDYAESVDVPTIGFIIDNDASWPNSKRDSESEKQTSLKNFKDKVQKHMVGFWTNKEDLYGKVAIALMKAFQATPRIGWTRASNLINPELTNELSRLSAENAALRQDLTKALNKRGASEAHNVENILKILTKNNWEFLVYYEDSKDWESGTSESFYRLFDLIAPEMMVEKSISALSTYFGRMLYSSKDKKVRKLWPVPSNSVKEFMVDLMSLGLVRPSTKKHAVADKDEYWCLTSLGQKIYLQIRRNTLDKDGDKAKE